MKFIRKVCFWKKWKNEKVSTKNEKQFKTFNLLPRNGLMPTKSIDEWFRGVQMNKRRVFMHRHR